MEYTGKLVLIFIFCFSFQFLQSQNLLQGRITDQDLAPMQGANIFIHELNKGTISDKKGGFLLENIPNGKFRIQFSFVGYSTEIRTVIFNGSLVEMNLILTETSIETKEIVISGGYNATQHENAVNIEILKLKSSTNIATPNTTELLTKVPGVAMISKGPGVSKPVIRGLSMDNVLVLNNGIRNENYQYSDHHPLGLDEFGIEDVEIIKGPASLLYGSDAIGGVVNFIREKPAPVGQVIGGYHLQFFSNTLGLSTNLGIKGASKKVFGGIRLGTKTNADFLQGGGDFVPNSRFNTMSIKTDGGYSGKKIVSRLFYEYNRQKSGLTENEAVDEITARGRKLEIWYQQFNNHLLSLQNKIFLSNFKLDVNASIQSVGLNHFAEENVMEISMRLFTFSYETRLYLPSTEKSEYIIGLQGFNQVNNNLEGAEEILLPDAHTGNYGLFTLLQYYFFHGFKIQAGLRYDQKIISTQEVGVLEDEDFRDALEKDYGSFSGSVGATYDIREKLFLRANFAAAYRTPNLAELTSNGKHETRYELGNSSLMPQRAYETDFSMHYHIKNLTFDLAGFYNIINRYIFIHPTGDSTDTGEQIYLYTQSNALLVGWEAGFHFHPEKWKWLHIEGTYSAVRGKQSNGDFLPFIPANKIYFELKFEKDKLGDLKDSYIGFNTAISFRQDHPAPEEEPTSGYTLINLSIGTTISIQRQSLMVSFGINNLFYKKYVDHLSTLKEVNFFEPGRSIILTISMPLTIK